MKHGRDTNSKPIGRTRSAISNGTRLLDGVDGRKPAARRFKDLIAAYSADLGTSFGQMTEGQRTIVRQAAGVSLQCEQMQAAIVRGERVDDTQLVRVSNLLARLLKALGLGPVTPSEDEPDLSDYLKDRAA
jgi:hypothetical protein